MLTSKQLCLFLIVPRVFGCFILITAPISISKDKETFAKYFRFPYHIYIIWKVRADIICLTLCKTQ